MPDGRFIAYYRVSTAAQGRSGLGLSAQKAAVTQYLNGGKWSLLAEFTEVESGKNNDRPKLAEAIQHCRLTGSRLVIAKLDRLSRNAAFTLALRDSGIAFVAADMPDANEMTVGIMAVVAQGERKAISERTKAALARSTKKLGGIRLNHKPVDSALGAAGARRAAVEFARSVYPVIKPMVDQGMSLRAIAAELSARSIQTRAGGTWSATQVGRVIQAAAEA